MEKHTWHRIAADKDHKEPSPRWGHCATQRNNHIIYFGGYAGNHFITQIPNIWTIYGPSTPKTWPGRNTKLEEMYPPSDRIVLCTMMNTTIQWLYSVEVATIKEGSILLVFWIGILRYGDKSLPFLINLLLGREHTILQHYCTPISSSLEVRESLTWMIFGYSTWKLIDGGKSRLIRANLDHLLVGFIHRFYWVMTFMWSLVVMINTEVWAISGR